MAEDQNIVGRIYLRSIQDERVPVTMAALVRNTAGERARSLDDNAHEQTKHYFLIFFFLIEF